MLERMANVVHVGKGSKKLVTISDNKQKTTSGKGLTHSRTLLEEKRRRPPQYPANARGGIHSSCPRLRAVEGKAYLGTPEIG
jgi:hypothetical protein